MNTWDKWIDTQECVDVDSDLPQFKYARISRVWIASITGSVHRAGGLDNYARLLLLENEGA